MLACDISADILDEILRMSEDSITISMEYFLKVCIYRFCRAVSTGAKWERFKRNNACQCGKGLSWVRWINWFPKLVLDKLSFRLGRAVQGEREKAGRGFRSYWGRAIFDLACILWKPCGFWILLNSRYFKEYTCYDTWILHSRPLYHTSTLGQLSVWNFPIWWNSEQTAVSTFPLIILHGMKNIGLIYCNINTTYHSLVWTREWDTILPKIGQPAFIVTRGFSQQRSSLSLPFNNTWNICWWVSFLNWLRY